MKKKLVRAALVAGLTVLFASAAFTVTSAAADDSAKPKISKSLSKPLSDAQKAFTAKDWPTMIANMKLAQAVADQTDYDKYIVNYYSGLAYYNSGDKAQATDFFVAAAESTAAPPEDRATALHIAIDLENQAKNYPKEIELGLMAEKAGALNSPAAAELAVAYYNTADYVNAKLYAQKSIDADAAAGKLGDRAAYQVVLMSQNRQKDVPGELATLGLMSKDFGDPEDWGNYIDVSLGTLPTLPSREISALYFYRLRLTVGAKTRADDYLLMCELSLGLRFPGEAQRSVQAGIKAGVIEQTQPKVAACMNKANAAVRTDEPALAAADAAAAKSPNATGDLSVAEDYYGYGRYADSVRVAQRAIGKGGPKAAEAQLLVGVVQAVQGDAAAAQSLAAVRGDAGLEKVAAAWTLYVTRKYGQPAAPPATPPAAH